MLLHYLSQRVTLLARSGDSLMLPATIAAIFIGLRYRRYETGVLSEPFCLNLAWLGLIAVPYSRLYRICTANYVRSFGLVAVMPQ